MGKKYRPNVPRDGRAAYYAGFPIDANPFNGPRVRKWDDDWVAARKRHAYEVAGRVEVLPRLDDIAVFAPTVIALMRGIGDVWRTLDEKPGLFSRAYNDRFYMLRQVRNSPVYGPQLFAAINEHKEVQY